MAEYLFEAAVSFTSAASANVPLTTILAATSPARLPEIREIGVFMSTAAAGGGEVGIGRPAAAGITPGTSVTVDRDNPADGTSGGTKLVTTWTTAPTAPSVFKRRIQLAATIGTGVVFVWGPGEFVIPAGGNIAVWQISAVAQTYDIYAKVAE